MVIESILVGPNLELYYFSTMGKSNTVQKPAILFGCNHDHGRPIRMWCILFYLACLLLLGRRRSCIAASEGMVPKLAENSVVTFPYNEENTSHNSTIVLFWPQGFHPTSSQDKYSVKTMNMSDSYISSSTLPYTVSYLSFISGSLIMTFSN